VGWIVCAVLFFSATAAAQSELLDVQVAHHIERRESGIVLFAGGIGSVLGGAITASAGRFDPFTLMFGVGTALWGAVNTALSIHMIDFGDGQLARLRREPRSRDEAIRAQASTGIFYAVNLFLDFFYLASAIVIYALADRAPNEREHLRGYATAQIAQGLFLFGFDLVGALTSDRRAQRLRRIP
jgi:hypothetical protein